MARQVLRRPTGRVRVHPMTTTLISQQDAESKIASLTAGPCNIAVMDECAFEYKWLPLGEITLKPANAPKPGAENADDENQRALLASDGTFEWSPPSASDTKEALEQLLKDKNDAAIRRALDSIAAIGVRTGLVHPIFDPGAIEDMPFRRSTTVVSDTTGLLQGGLDFIVRHIPKARIKVPAIVQMEIRNFSHRFFKMRRNLAEGNKKKGQHTTKQLIEHLKSQGAERSLLRLELHEDVEIERTYLLGDPLRSAFAPDRDDTLKDLQLSVPQDAYVDRLILEAARHHQAQSEPGHGVLLLTSDQGQARMALAEGVKPLYFRSVSAEDLFGQRLTGRPLDPFTGEPRPVALASLLWELATAFGSASLSSDKATFVATALGEELPWSPYHSTDDLLWYEIKDNESGSGVILRLTSKVDGEPAAKEGPLAVVPRPARPTSYQRMNVNKLLTLVCALDDRQSVGQAEISELLQLSTYSISHYRRFLVSAGYIALEGDRWVATGRLKEVSIAAREGDPQSMQSALNHAPSYRAFVQYVQGLNKGEALDLSDLGRTSRTYLVLGELTLLCASVGKDAVYPAWNRPKPAEFAKLALARFREVAGNEAIGATGLWLESLIQHDGIHPEVARRSLEQASEAGLLRRSTEGSTTQTQYDDHVVHVLRVEDGAPVAKPIHLYRGDYLIPNKASVSLRLEGPKP